MMTKKKKQTKIESMTSHKKNNKKQPTNIINITDKKTKLTSVEDCGTWLIDVGVDVVKPDKQKKQHARTMRVKISGHLKMLKLTMKLNGEG